MKNLNLGKRRIIDGRNLGLVCVLLILFVALFSMFVSDEAVAKDGITLSFAMPPSPREHTSVQGMFLFKKLVEEGSDGAITINIYHSGELSTGDLPLIPLTQSGAVDISNITNPTIASIEPMLSVLNMPYLFRDKEHANKVLASDILQPYIDELKNKKLISLIVYNETWRHLFNSKRPIYTPEDLKGLKMRAMETPVNVATMNAMGANATPMAWAEVYLSLKNKTIDGLAIQINPTYTNSFYETGSYLSLTYSILQQFWYVMNLEKFNSLSSEHQEILLKSAKEAGLYSSRITDESEIQMVGELILKHGMSINNANVELFRKATESVYEKFKDQFTPELVESIRRIE